MLNRIEIQRLVRQVAMRYDERIHARLEELGIEDYVWKAGEVSFWKTQKIPNPPVEQHCTVMV